MREPGDPVDAASSRSKETQARIEYNSLQRTHRSQQRLEEVFDLILDLRSLGTLLATQLGRFYLELERDWDLE